MFSIFNGENQGDLQRLKAKNPDRKEDATIIVARKTMKKVRIFAAMAALMTLGLAACNGENATESASAAPTSSKAASSAAKSSSKKPSSSKAVSSSKPAGPDYTQVIAHTWTDGTPAANADGKNYIPLTDATANKVGVKIAIMDFAVPSDAAEGTTLGSDGKIAPVNEKTAYIVWKVKAPKAGDYQMVMTAKSSDTGVGKTLGDRSVTVRLNGTAVDIDGTTYQTQTVKEKEWQKRRDIKATTKGMITVTPGQHNVKVFRGDTEVYSKKLFISASETKAVKL